MVTGAAWGLQNQCAGPTFGCVELPGAEEYCPVHLWPAAGPRQGCCRAARSPPHHTELPNATPSCQPASKGHTVSPREQQCKGSQVQQPVNSAAKRLDYEPACPTTHGEPMGSLWLFGSLCCQPRAPRCLGSAACTACRAARRSVCAAPGQSQRSLRTVRTSPCRNTSGHSS